MAERVLDVVMYHYVRDVAGTPFPRLHSVGVAEFRRHVKALADHYEMATLESALAFLRGGYAPARDLCLLTFDDGLRDHYSNVMPILHAYGIQGAFFVITGSVEGRVAAVHKNHFLAAALEPATYRREALALITELAPSQSLAVDPAAVRARYRWDTPETGAFKYLLNFVLPEPLRRRVLDTLFARHLGDEGAFARDLYVGVAELRSMAADGMVLGGHTHTHATLASLAPAGQREEIEGCLRHLDAWLPGAPARPFCYPYGKPGTFDDASPKLVAAAGFSCALTSVVGSNVAGADPYALRRLDPKDCGVLTT